MPQSLDQQAKSYLQGWRQVTKVFSAPLPAPLWLRAQPKDGVTTGPTIVAAGSGAFSTQPDGLWLALGESCVHAFVIEACGNGQNFNDKRARYQARTSALMLRLPLNWLRHHIRRQSGGQRPRWQLLGLSEEPAVEIALPVRSLRVLYALRSVHYNAAFTEIPLEAHEFLARVTDLRNWSSPPLQRLLKRASIQAHFLSSRPHAP